MKACLDEINIKEGTRFTFDLGRGEAPILGQWNDNLGFKIVDIQCDCAKILSLNISRRFFELEGLPSSAKARIKIKLLEFFSPDNMNLHAEEEIT